MLGRPLPAQVLADKKSVWGDLPDSEHSLWNAKLFPVAQVGAANTYVCFKKKKRKKENRKNNNK